MPHTNTNTNTNASGDRFTPHAGALLNSYELRLMAGELLERQGLQARRLFEGTGVTPGLLANPGQRLSPEQELSLYTRFAHLNLDPMLGLRVGRRLNLPNYGILGSAMMASATVGEALQLLVEFAPLVSWSSHASLATVRHSGIDACRLTIFPTAADPLAAALEVESTFASLQTVFNELVGEQLPFSELQMRHSVPNSEDGRYRDLFHCPVRFGCRRNAILLPAGQLQRPLPHPQPEYRELFRDLCRQASSALTGERGLAAAVRNQLRYEGESPPGLEQMAARFNLSARTLRRHLGRAGLSYRALLDESRYGLARHYLASTGLTVESVGRRLGYSDARSFRTAFKRWSGQTPAAYRASMAVS